MFKTLQWNHSPAVERFPPSCYTHRATKERQRERRLGTSQLIFILNMAVTWHINISQLRIIATLTPERGDCRNTFANVLRSDYDRILAPKGNYRVTSTSGSLLIPPVHGKGVKPIMALFSGCCAILTSPKKGRKSCLWLQSRSVLSSFGVVLMSCRVNFHVVRSALQYSACRILYV